MQPKSSEANTPPQTRRPVSTPRTSADEAVGSFRIDTPDETSSIIKAPHAPMRSTRTATGRIRGDRPNSSGVASEQVANAVDAAAGTPPNPGAVSSHLSPVVSSTLEPERTAGLESGEGESTSDFQWGSLHAEDIARVLDQRLFEVERRERTTHRRLAQLAQQERMFRLWANETRQELERQRRELQRFEADLIKRSHDLRWLLVYGDQFDPKSPDTKLGTEVAARSGDSALSGDFDCISRAAPQHGDFAPPFARTDFVEDKVAAEVEQLSFRADTSGVRRWSPEPQPQNPLPQSPLNANLSR